MPYIKVKLSKFDNYKNDVKKVYKNLDNIQRNFATIGKNLDWDVKRSRQIYSQIQSIAYDELESTIQSVNKAIYFWDSALTKYENVVISVENLLDGIKETFLQKRQERQEYIDNIELGVSILFGIATIAATACGLGPAVILGITALKSVVETTTEHLGDSYIETGEVQMDDWGEYGKDLFVDTIVDVGIEYCGGKMLSGVIGDSIEGSFKISKTALGHAGQKLVSSASGEVASGIITGSMGRYVESYGDCIYDSISSGMSVLDSVSSASTRANLAIVDKEALASDALSGLAAGIGEAGGVLVEDKLGMTVLQSGFYSNNKSTRVVTTAAQGAAKKATEGIIERGADEALKSAFVEQDFALEDVGDAMFNPIKIVGDALSGAAKSGRKEADKEVVGFRQDMSKHKIYKVNDNKKISEADRYADKTGFAAEMPLKSEAKLYTEWLKTHEPQNSQKDI